MALTPKPKILVIANNAASARDWEKSLAGDVAALWCSPLEIPPDQDPDVIVVAGGDVSAWELASGGALNPKVVVIGEGGACPADFRVPADVTPRELLMACVLLAQTRDVERECQRLAQHHRESRQLAETDPLTGLANRRVWDQEVIRRSRQSAEGQPSWLAIADLDCFKRVNDVSGYAAGDRVLVEVGQKLSANLRRDDLLARLGGDEFGVLLSGLDEVQARVVLQRLASALVSLPEDVPRLSISLGYALLGPEKTSEAFATAERGLRAAKRAGGNRVVAGDVNQS